MESKIQEQEQEQEQEQYNEEIKKTDLDIYINQLSSLERSVFEIASGHLCSSFSLRHSIGFIKWSENNAQSK